MKNVLRAALGTALLAAAVLSTHAQALKPDNTFTPIRRDGDDLMGRLVVIGLPASMQSATKCYAEVGAGCTQPDATSVIWARGDASSEGGLADGSAPMLTVDASLPTDIYGFGVSANPGQTPSVSGTALWAHSLNGSGTYAGTIVDFLPETIKPIVVSTNVGAFVAQKVATVKGHDIFATGSTGIAVTGAHTGWNYTGGGAIFFKLPQPNWFLSANVRFSKSTVSGANAFQLIPGVQLNWGK
ncbi:hypothetical protein [Terriglobus sp. RCC_193]|uniref:hypothetical protein n=1 Tax=Terriglobus sp. RCC_193 TaxID=3239218 RepID=UPI00352667F9